MSAHSSHLIVYSVEAWKEKLNDERLKNEIDVFKVILDHLDGYAIEYSIDRDADAQNLLNAFIAWKEIPD